MAVDERRIQELVGAVVQRLHQSGGPAPAPLKSDAVKLPKPRVGEDGIFDSIDGCVVAAREAQEKLSHLSLKARGLVLDAMRKAALDNAEHISRLAWQETGMGRYEDKLAKNRLVAVNTPGIEDLRPIAWTGDHGFTLIERAPWGVIGAIAPSTNPTSTIICNCIGMIAAGNAVVFNSHPGAKACSAETIRILNRAIVAAGGPPNLIAAIPEPTIPSAQEMMRHPGVNLLVVTGGPGVVKVAMSHPKKAICAGAGNPPAVVDDTADIEQAGRDIVRGASFDNNVVCVLEKETIVVASVADRLKAAMLKHGAYEIGHAQYRDLKKVIFDEDKGPNEESVVNKNFVGKDAQVILRHIGVDARPEVKLVLVEVDASDTLVWSEQLMPVMPLVRVRDADEAISLGVKAERGLRHTAVMHSKNIDHLSRMAREINSSIFVKNGPSIAGLGFGGEGFTSFSIASPTGEGLTSAKDFTRCRRCAVVDSFRIV